MPDSTQALLLPDLDGDGVVTTTEIEAQRYTELCQEGPLKKLVVEEFSPELEDFQRYPPWRRKALAKMRHSRKTWTGFERPTASARSSTVPKAATCPQTIWEAAILGDVNSVHRFLQSGNAPGVSKKILLGHSDIDGSVMPEEFDFQHRFGSGSTLLHYACWHAHLPLAQALLKWASDTCNDREVKDWVDSIDTCHRRATALMEVCRTSQGDLKDRLAIARELIRYGANAACVDCHGDNALHWAVRRSHKSIVTFLLYCTEEAVFTSTTLNNQRERPIDIAKRLNGEKSTMARLDIYNILLSSLKTSNVRLKIAKGKVERLKEKKDIEARKIKAHVQMLEKTHIFFGISQDSVQTVRRMVHLNRVKLEGAAVDKAGEKSIKESEAWVMKDAEGQEWFKNEVKQTSDEMRKDIKAKIMERPKKGKTLKEAIEIQARAKVKGIFYHKQEIKRREEMRATFRKEHAPMKEILMTLEDFFSSDSRLRLSGTVIQQISDGILHLEGLSATDQFEDKCANLGLTVEGSETSLEASLLVLPDKKTCIGVLAIHDMWSTVTNMVVSTENYEDQQPTQTLQARTKAKRSNRRK